MLIPILDRAHLLRRKTPRAPENRGQPVIILMFDRIKLVVMTPDTAERHSHKGFADGINLLIDNVHLKFLHIGLSQHPGTKRQKSGRRNRLPALRQKIARYLLNQKLVERFVLVKRTHHIVPIPPRISEGDIFVHAVGIRIPRHIQPMPPPALAVLWRCQQTLDDTVEGLGGVVGQKSFHLFHRRRQPDQVKRGTSD